MAGRVLRHQDSEEVIDAAATRLLRTIVELQASQDTVHLCLAGGGVANRIYERFAELLPDSSLDPGALHLWWADERFVATTDPERNSLQSLSILARTLSISSAQTHPMPASDGHADPDEAAFAYADELGETVFDICLLAIGMDGHVAAIFPGHEGMEPTSSLAIGVTEAPEPPAERISLSLNALNRSERIWVAAIGPERAPAIAAAVAGDERLPASHVHGTRETLWLVDADAAGELPMYRCTF